MENTQQTCRWFLNRGERPMDHTKGFWGTIISITSAFIAWINLQNAQIILTLIASLVAAVSGLFAARYYWYATKEKKQALKKINTP